MSSAVNYDYGKYCGACGYSNVELYDFETETVRAPWIEIDRIPSKRLSIRPRQAGFAVMLENTETFERVWLHVDPDPFE